LQRSKRERAFAHIVGETEANPFPLPHRSHAPQLAYFCGGNRGGGPILTRLCRRLATPTTVPIIARFFFGRFEGSMAGKPVAIIMGSQSDWPTMKHTADTLDALGIGYEAKIISAHRTPERHSTFTKAAKAQGFKIIIAGAGGAAHLPGVTAALTTLPVFGVPIESKALSGVDSLYSIVQMPPGVPVGTLAIGRAGAINAALLAASVLALADGELAKRLEAWRQRQTEAVPETPEDGKS
jgi:5-(carboxyamino)imidazole ribonucleotide mutase